ncbi:E3 ubiquitin-protein ligase RNF149 [Heterocephalus glaber]|uniref:E3 ubiquitin-protein ligase RNF149 n=1 Tax=Heterocephalus glaber TaxID=10181 RepID=G5C8V5_HETGA|nr:E3 ubiquitin-protein ligase RNF149 [Heterocephalus glaber]
MTWRGPPEGGALGLLALALALCARGAPGRTLLWHSAVVGLEYADLRTNRTVRSVFESSRFSEGSPRAPRRGLVGVPRAPGGDPGGCAPDARFLAPAPGPAVPWVALVARGDCPLRGRVLAAARGNASALVVYDEEHGGDLDATLAHAESGPGSVSAEMLSAAFPGEDRSIGSNLPSSSSSSSPSTSESGLQCTVTCAKDSGKHSIARLPWSLSDALLELR